MVKANKISKKNTKTTRFCRSVSVLLTRDDFSSHEKSKVKKHNESVLTANVSLNLRSRPVKEISSRERSKIKKSNKSISTTNVSSNLRHRVRKSKSKGMFYCSNINVIIFLKP